TARRLFGAGPAAGGDDALRRALLAGFADRVARRRGAGERALLADGRGARVAPESVVRTAPLFVAVEVEDTRPEVLGARVEQAGGTESLVRLASSVEERWLEEDLGVTEEVVVRFDPAREAVESVRERRYRALVLSAKPAEADPARVAEVLAEAAARAP